MGFPTVQTRKLTALPICLPRSLAAWRRAAATRDGGNFGYPIRPLDLHYTFMRLEVSARRSHLISHWFWYDGMNLGGYERRCVRVRATHATGAVRRNWQSASKSPIVLRRTPKQAAARGHERLRRQHAQRNAGHSDTSRTEPSTTDDWNDTDKDQPGSHGLNCRRTTSLFLEGVVWESAGSRHILTATLSPVSRHEIQTSPGAGARRGPRSTLADERMGATDGSHVCSTNTDPKPRVRRRITTVSPPPSKHSMR